MSATDHYLKRELYELIRSDESIFEFLQAGSLDGIWYWDLEKTDHEWMSPRFWEVFGYDPETKEHLVEEWQGMIFPEDLQVALENFAKHSEDPKHPYDQVVRYRHKDGHTVWVRCRGIIVRDDDGVPLRMLGAHTDVTGLKTSELVANEAAARLAEANAALEDFRAVLDASAVANLVWRMSAEQEPQLRLAMVNREAGVVFPGACEANLGSTIRAIDTELASSDLPEQLLAVLESGEPAATDYVKMEGAASEHRHYTVNIFRVRPGMVAMALTDVTRLRRAEAAVRASNRELEQFASVASHDLQEPLRMVRSFTELLQADYGDSLDEEGQRYLTYANDGAKRMHQLVNDLLEVSRIDARLGALAPVELRPLVLKLVEELQHSGTLGDVVVHVEELGTVLADRSLIRQVFQNLLSNAIKFNQNTSPQIWVRSRVSGRDREITVADNGIGIEPRHQEQVFDMFQRLHNREAYAGTGIGLAIASKIVALHGGSLWVDSELGQGSQFRFTLEMP